MPSKGGTFIHEKLLHLGKNSDDLWLLSKEPFPASCSVRCKCHPGDRLLVPQCCAGVGGSWHCHFPAALGRADLLPGRCGPEVWSTLYPAPHLLGWGSSQVQQADGTQPIGSVLGQATQKGQGSWLQGKWARPYLVPPLTVAEVHWGEAGCKSFHAGTDFGIECEEVGAHGIIQNSRDLPGEELGLAAPGEMVGQLQMEQRDAHKDLPCRG